MVLRNYDLMSGFSKQYLQYLETTWISFTGLFGVQTQEATKGQTKCWLTQLGSLTISTYKISLYNEPSLRHCQSGTNS